MIIDDSNDAITESIPDNRTIWTNRVCALFAHKIL
jgi:hypothetical protein